MFLSDTERQKALKALKKRLGITGEVPRTGGEINALPVGTFLLKHGNTLRNFVPAEKPIGFLRVGNTRKGWIVGVLGSGGGFRGPVDPLGVLEVVPLTPTLLASMVDVGPSYAWIPLPRSAGYGKADRQAWAYWVGAEILDAGSSARRALKDAIETMVGSEVKIGDITWNPGQNIRVEFEEPGKKPSSMGFLKNGNAGVVRVKVVGGTTKTPLFVGHDSKGRAKYELIPPKGQRAVSVASMLRTSAKKGEKLFGGDVYVIRVSVGGKEYDYYKAK